MSKKLLPLLMSGSESLDDSSVAIAIIGDNKSDIDSLVTEAEWENFRSLYPTRPFVLLQPEANFNTPQPATQAEADEWFIQTPANFDAELVNPNAPTYFIANTTTLGESGFPQFAHTQVQTKSNLDSTFSNQDPRKIYEVVNDPNPGLNYTYVWTKTDKFSGPRWIPTDVSRTSFGNIIRRDAGNPNRDDIWRNDINSRCFDMDAQIGIFLKYINFDIFIDGTGRYTSDSLDVTDVILSYLEFLRNTTGRGGTVRVGLEQGSGSPSSLGAKNWIRPFLGNVTWRTIASLDDECLRWGTFPPADADFTIVTESYFGAIRVASGADRLINYSNLSSSDSQRINPTLTFDKGDKILFIHNPPSSTLDDNDSNQEIIYIKRSSSTSTLDILVKGGNVSYSSDWSIGEGQVRTIVGAPSQNYDDWTDTDNDGLGDWYQQNILWHTGVNAVGSGTYYYQSIRDANLGCEILIRP